jgi:hypothetical protein
MRRQRAPSFAVASDRAYVPQPFAVDEAPVVVLTPHFLLEAYTRLLLRYRESYSSFFISMICYVAKYVEEGNADKARLDLKYVPSACRRFFNGVKHDEGEQSAPMGQLLEELQRNMN